MKKASYNACHKWLAAYCGAPKYCEATECDRTSRRYEWALVKGKSHAKERTNYIRLCKKCHSSYDGIPLFMSKRQWKGGNPNCKNCSTKLTRRDTKTGLCKSCCYKNQHPREKNSPRYTFKGKTLSLKGWSMELGVKRQTLQSRLSRGWSVERMLTI